MKGSGNDYYSHVRAASRDHQRWMPAVPLQDLAFKTFGTYAEDGENLATSLESFARSAAHVGGRSSPGVVQSAIVGAALGRPSSVPIVLQVGNEGSVGMYIASAPGKDVARAVMMSLLLLGLSLTSCTRTYRFNTAPPIASLAATALSGRAIGLASRAFHKHTRQRCMGRRSY